MTIKSWIRIIKEVAEENEFNLSEGEKSFRIEKGQFHAEYFYIKSNPSKCLEVSTWEGLSEDYGRAIYSLRSTTDVIKFCNILVTSQELRARR